MSYYLTPEADTELTEAVAFYAERVSLTVARNFLRKFEELLCKSSRLSFRSKFNSERNYWIREFHSFKYDRVSVIKYCIARHHIF